MSDEPRLETSSPTIREGWREITENTLRKTLPQCLLGIWYWGVVLGRRDLDSLTSPSLLWILLFVIGLGFYAIVLTRVAGVVLSRRHESLLHLLARFWVLFMGYSLWLGLGLPVHRRDVREWLAWTAMACGLVAMLVLARPVFTA